MTRYDVLPWLRVDVTRDVGLFLGGEEVDDLYDVHVYPDAHCRVMVSRGSRNRTMASVRIGGTRCSCYGSATQWLVSSDGVFQFVQSEDTPFEDVRLPLVGTVPLPKEVTIRLPLDVGMTHKAPAIDALVRTVREFSELLDRCIEKIREAHAPNRVSTNDGA